MPPKVWGSTPAKNTNNSGGLSRAPPPPPHQKQQKKDDDKGWTKSSTLQQDQDKLTRKSLDFANTAAKVATSVDEAAANLKKFIIKTVHDNNHLGLPDEEINNMAKLLMQTPNKNEIYQWAETLMQPKSFAEDIIKQRDIAAQQFASKGKDRRNASDDDDDDGSATTASGYSVATTSASTATSRRKEGKGTRGKVVNLGKKGGDADRGVLVEGAQFECGCFGTSHDFRSNCANCGRIFCMQESDEVCYSCQLPPQSCLALDLRQALGKISDASDRKDREGLEVALKRRDQLLQFAKERSKRTQIIDDQSGMHGKLDPWSSRAERAKASVAEEEERKKIAELHKRTGAVTVHLDIVNEAISLGATAISKKDDAESMKESVVEMGLGFGGDDSEEKKQKNAAMTEDELQQQRRAEEAAVCAGISPQKKNTFTTTKTTSAAPINLQKLGKNNSNQQQEEEENQSDEENDDDEISKDEINYGEEEMIDDDGTRRVIALPSLMQQIFYCNSEEEAAEKTKIKASLKQSQNAGSLYVGGSKQRNSNASNKNDDQQQSQSHHRRAVDFRRPDDRKTGNSTGVTLKESNEKLSRRVQVDYFEGDNDTWLMAEQQDELLESKDEENNTSNKKNRFAQQQDARLGERFIDQARLMNVTMEDAKDWKDSDAKKEMGGGFNNKNNDDDDDESIPKQQQLSSSSSSSAAAGGLFFQLQQQARKLIHKDEGWCLSMHQPWASLLIAGIKTHEGRTWPTEWRGRLWIHAAAAKPTQETIDEVEAHARQFVPEGTKFPTSYPTKCLLGCAAMVDCLDRERYETVFPTPDQQQLSESSTHCFLCLNPKVLPFPLAMDGNHKLYKLDKKHWQAARKLFKETV